jgi:hypothetical protein
VEELSIRPLKVKDVFAIARMLGKITKSAREELASNIKDAKADRTELGIAIIQSIFTVAEEDLKSWLADLIGKDKTEFEAMSANALLDIIEKLSEQEDIKDFFAKASQLASRFISKK